MRWLVVHPGPQFSVADVHAGWAEALRALGETVVEYDLDKRIQFHDAALLETGTFDEDGRPQVRKAFTQDEALKLAADGIMSVCYQVWPDVVLGVSAFFLRPYQLQIMRSRRHRIVLLHTESPYEEEAQLERAQYANVNLLNDPVNIGRYRDLGIPAAYVPHAYRPHIHRPGPGRAEYKSDFAFVGTGYKSRVEFFEAMDLSGLDVLLAGPWHELAEDSPLRAFIPPQMAAGAGRVACVDNQTGADIYRSTQAGINFYRRESEDGHAGEGWALGPREVEMAACGLFYLRDPRGEGDGLLPMLPTFDGPGDAGEKLRWWLGRPGQRAEAAARARAALAGRTFEANARELLRLLDA